MVTLTIGTRMESPEQEVQLAAERFNRHTFWCGQSGSGKTYPNVLSQCDNLGLMRMNSPRDLANVFGFVPDDLLGRSQRFNQGQALFAGGFIGQPTLVQMGSRVTEEGGTDVAVPLPSQERSGVAAQIATT